MEAGHWVLPRARCLAELLGRQGTVPGGYFRPGTGEPVALARVGGTKVGDPPRQSLHPHPLTHVLGLSSQPQKLASHLMSR